MPAKPIIAIANAVGQTILTEIENSGQSPIV
jgi:hypothetical protein